MIFPVTELYHLGDMYNGVTITDAAVEAFSSVEEFRKILVSSLTKWF
jgi:hypothetical protein